MISLYVVCARKLIQGNMVAFQTSEVLLSKEESMKEVSMQIETVSCQLVSIKTCRIYIHLYIVFRRVSIMIDDITKKK